MRRYRTNLGQCLDGDANDPRQDRDQFSQYVDRIGSVLRRTREYPGQRNERRGRRTALSWALHRAEALAAHVAVVLLGLAAAFSPSYKPTTRSTCTPYIGHSFTLLRMTLHPRARGPLFSFADGLHLLCIL